jgi:hypothetical protein
MALVTASHSHPWLSFNPFAFFFVLPPGQLIDLSSSMHLYTAVPAGLPTSYTLLARL